MDCYLLYEVVLAVRMMEMGVRRRRGSGGDGTRARAWIIPLGPRLWVVLKIRGLYQKEMNVMATLIIPLRTLATMIPATGRMVLLTGVVDRVSTAAEAIRQGHSWPTSRH